VVRALPFKLSVCKMMSSLSDYVPYILAKFSSYLLRPRPSKFQSTGFVIVTSRKNHLPCSHGSSASIPPEIPTSYLVLCRSASGKGVTWSHSTARCFPPSFMARNTCPTNPPSNQLYEASGDLVDRDRRSRWAGDGRERLAWTIAKGNDRPQHADTRGFTNDVIWCQDLRRSWDDIIGEPANSRREWKQKAMWLAPSELLRSQRLSERVDPYLIEFLTPEIQESIRGG
jgi:hypothetical protein